MITGPPDDYTNHLKTAAHEVFSMNIIERLRSKSPYLDGSSAERTMEEAADEIERWKAEAQARTTAVIEVTRKAAEEIERLRVIEDAAIDAATYFYMSDGGEKDFDEQIMVNLMAKLGRALEPKP